MKTKTTTSVDGRITLHHNIQWVGNVEIVIGSREGTCYGATIPASLLRSGDFDRSVDLCGEIGERDMRKATAMAAVSAARSAVDLLSSITIKDVDHG